MKPERESTLIYINNYKNCSFSAMADKIRSIFEMNWLKSFLLCLKFDSIKVLYNCVDLVYNIKYLSDNLCKKL